MPRQDGTPGLLRIADIVIDKRLEVRAEGSDPEHAEQMAEAVKKKGGKKLPRVKVRVVKDPPNYKPGVYTFAVDGKHTIKAHTLAGRKSVPCIIKHTTWEQAVFDAATSNQGPRALPMRSRDKVKAVEMILTVHGDDSDDPWSNAMIAKELGVSDEFVRQHRPQLPTVGGSPKRRGTDNKTRPAKPQREPAPDRDDKARLLHIGSIEVADYVAAAFELAKVMNLGQLADLLAQGGLASLKPQTRQDLIDELKGRGVLPRRNLPAAPRVGKDPAPQKPGDVMYDWAAFDAHYGFVARGPDVIGNLFPQVKPECDGLTRLLTEFRSAWERVKATVTKSEE